MNSIPSDDPDSHEHFRAEVSKLLAATAKIQAQWHEVNARTAKLTTESKYYPFVVGAGLLAAGGALVKMFF